MITELEKETRDRQKLENGVRLCEEAIAKAEKYERLSENKDWTAYLEDLKILADVHDREIKMACSMLPDAPNHSYVKHDETGSEVHVSCKSDWTDYIARHEVQRNEALNWVKEPARIIAMARLAREKLPLLKESLAKIPAHGTKENGKS